MGCDADDAAQRGHAQFRHDQSEAEMGARERRERIATALAQRLVSCLDDSEPRNLARVAVGYADALIAELDK